MITVIYNEGLGFTESRKEYETLEEALIEEGKRLIEGGRVYKNGIRLL